MNEEMKLEFIDETLMNFKQFCEKKGYCYISIGDITDGLIQEYLKFLKEQGIHS